MSVSPSQPNEQNIASKRVARSSGASRISTLDGAASPRRQTELKPLLFSFRQTAALLNCSPMTIRRLVDEGRLKVVRLRNGMSSTKYLRAEEIYALVKGGEDAGN